MRLECDASDKGAGVVLSQEQSDGNWKPVRFASKKLINHQKIWMTLEKECSRKRMFCGGLGSSLFSILLRIKLFLRRCYLIYF